MKDEREHSNLKSSQILVKKSAPFGKRSQNLYYHVQGYNAILCTKVYSCIHVYRDVPHINARILNPYIMYSVAN